ncbi:MAG: leucyl/phenylalanyl-tRNA--protein transferase [Rhizobiales bacterium]|nr:leucyl/phenylalanyl-tRNA--protein transferase [Hyphomicrobiales bacterium]
MTQRNSNETEVTPELLLRAYACGIFPMADDADDPTLFWVEPRARGIIPLKGFHIASRLARTVRANSFTVVCNRDFTGVIGACAQPRASSDRTWINGRIRALYGELFDRGHCHTVEAYSGGVLVGGLYGVSLGAAFFGESMFHRERDASKVALVHLVARLRAGGFQLLDTQFVTPHLQTFGAEEVSLARYHRLLDAAVEKDADFATLPLDAPLDGAEALRLALDGPAG